jgi:hypothetical protein
LARYDCVGVGVGWRVGVGVGWRVGADVGVRIVIVVLVVFIFNYIAERMMCAV